jgi:hypothetical protein
MKKISIITTLLLFIAMTFTSESMAQNFSKLDVSPMDAASYPSDYKVSLKEVKVIYSRPQLKERTLSELAPNGKVWRTGANEATEITFYKDMFLGETPIKAGTYSLFTIPGEKAWTIIISKDLNVWGSYFYNEKNDVARIKVPVTVKKDSVEAFSIAFEGSKNGFDMYLGWSNVRVSVPFKDRFAK